MILEEPLVSICSTTFNREKYIGQAIESWLSQKVNFSFEIVISDDCSTDNTIQIIEEYIELNPNVKIKLLKSAKNQGFVKNSIKVYESAKGKYIAHCDGDDYWIDDYKLQKQFDFLENNADYVMCFTNSYIINDYTNEKRKAKVNIWDTCTTRDILEEHNSLKAAKYGEIQTLAHMSSILFRNYLIKSFPKWYYTTYMNDDTLFVMLSKFGKAKLINEICAVYRFNEEGVSKKNFSFEKDLKGRIKFYKDLNKYLNFEFHNSIAKLLFEYNYKLSKLYFRNNNIIYLTITLFETFYIKLYIQFYRFKSMFKY
ncbi:glycosyltransferase [Spirosoma fluviale]|uniref:Glycosyltransferase involved in cell wall bisynthesis n=1 Tax=Spirosoma fluviale TaxID=1597977 RepID=A0A286FD82_9BACT|nr:glycosyltransferase [Spirosoma fluviale]SOD81207.1 Glycosyltransferase involved in cell wall bisynthesis [Spirosoma fluviale]